MLLLYSSHSVAAAALSLVWKWSHLDHGLNLWPGQRVVRNEYLYRTCTICVLRANKIQHATIWDVELAKKCAAFTWLWNLLQILPLTSLSPTFSPLTQSWLRLSFKPRSLSVSASAWFSRRCWGGIEFFTTRHMRISETKRGSDWLE